MNTRFRDLILAGVLMAVAVALGCGEANPLPSPFEGVDGPAVNENQVYASSVGPEESEGMLMLIGLPDAAVNASVVRVQIPDIAYDVDLAPATDGSFSTLVDGVANGAQVLVMPVLLDDGSDAELIGATLTLTVGQVDRADDDQMPWVAPSAEVSGGDEPGNYDNGAGAEVPDPAEGQDGEGLWSPTGVEVSAPDANGDVVITVPAYGMSAFTLLFVLDDDTGVTWAQLSGNDGSLTMTVQAQAGHTLWLFAANPVAQDSTTETFSIVVPAAN